MKHLVDASLAIDGTLDHADQAKLAAARHRYHSAILIGTIRMSKLRTKVSGSMRSMTGAQAFCAIRSYLSTAAKHGITMLDALARAASRTAWIPETS